MCHIDLISRKCLKSESTQFQSQRTQNYGLHFNQKELESGRAIAAKYLLGKALGRKVPDNDGQKRKSEGYVNFLKA